VGLNISGIIENMSGFICPHCKDCTYLFTKNGGQMLAEKIICPFLGIKIVLKFNSEKFEISFIE
jgi:Mrp family chromosome partitioning ATPase